MSAATAPPATTDTQADVVAEHALTFARTVFSRHHADLPVDPQWVSDMWDVTVGRVTGLPLLPDGLTPADLTGRRTDDGGPY